MLKIAIIQKLPDGKYRLYSKKKGPDGKRKNLGTYDSRAGAEKREKQVQFFKQQADDGHSGSKEDHMLRDLSNIAGFLEESGMIDKADKVYMAMGLVDGSLEDYLMDPYMGSDAERNVENSGFIGGPSPIGGGYGGLSIDEGQRADDIEQHHVDIAAQSNGLRGITQIHDNNVGMFQGQNPESQFSGGISYRNLEGPYR